MKRQLEQVPKKTIDFYPEYHEQHDFEWYSSYDGNKNNQTGHPLFKKDVFLFKMLLSACLVLAIAILFKIKIQN